MKVLVEDNNYDDFLKNRFLSGSFLQSSYWKYFLKKQNKRYWQLAVIDNNETIAVCLIYENKLPFDRSYIYSPKGPIFLPNLSGEQKKEALELILSKARDITIKTKKKEEVFFRLETEENKNIYDFLIKTNDIQPRDTLVLGLKKDIKELLSEMHQKTRYNIGLANRRGVKVVFSKKKEDIKYFLEVIKKTASKKQITIHSDEYYKLLYYTLIEKGVGQLCLASVNNNIVAANLIINFGNTVTYLHGGTDYSFRKYMAPYLLQWETIKQAKEKGFSFYDFWGVAPEDGSKTKWSGITRFKKGFGGDIITGPGTYDMVYDKQMYFIYNLFKKIKKIIKK